MAIKKEDDNKVIVFHNRKNYKLQNPYKNMVSKVWDYLFWIIAGIILVFLIWRIVR